MGRWTLLGGLRRCVLRRRARGERQRRGLHGGRRGSASLEHRARRRAVRRHEGEDQRDEQEDTGAPPGDPGEQGRRLSTTHGLASLGGGAGTEQFMGGRQATTLLTRITWWCAGIFLFISLVLAFTSAHSPAPRGAR